MRTIDRADEREHRSRHTDYSPGCALCLAEAADGFARSIEMAWPGVDVLCGEPAGSSVSLVVMLEGRPLLAATYTDGVRPTFDRDTRLTRDRLTRRLADEVAVAARLTGPDGRRILGQARARLFAVEGWQEDLETHA